jgi:DMSO reductase anchor subunit
MNTPEENSRRDNSSDSSEAIVGSGITVAAIGVLFLLLGFAQSMRGQPAAAMILCIIGAVLLVGGGVVTGMGKSRKGR